MKELKFVYPGFLFVSKEVTVKIPETWPEMNERQFLLAVRLQQQEINDITLISQFFGISERVISKISNFELYSLINLIDFLVYPKATINYFIINRIPKTKLLSPATKLRDITMKRFILFDTLFFDYLNNKQEKDLLRMVAMLYMKEGECSESVDIDKRVDFLKKNVDGTILNAVLLNYIFVRKWLAKAFRHVFSFVEDDDTELKKTRVPTPSKPTRPDWIRIVDDFASNDITNLEKYHRMKATVFFRLMNRRISNYHKNGLNK